MPLDLVLTNTRILTESGIVEAGIAIDNGKIHSIRKQTNLPRASKTINIQNNVVLPGLIDVHTHLRDLKLKCKEDFYSGTCAAAAGGYTTVLDMPNTEPPTNSSLRLKQKMEIAGSKNIINLGFYASFPPEIREFENIKKIGAIGYKIYFNHPITKLDIENEQVLFQAFKKAAELKQIIAVHAEKRSNIGEINKKNKSSVRNTLQAYLEAHPPKAEVESIQQIISLTKKTGVKLHICHISTAQSIQLMQEENNPQITCEVTPHHLLLSKEDLINQGGIAVTDPPFRSHKARFYLQFALNKAMIDIVASDHAPHRPLEKTESIWKVPPGIPGLETTLPLLLTMVKDRKISFIRLIEVLAKRPAQIFNLRGKGDIKPGFDADLTIIDLKKKYSIDSSSFHTKAKYSPFNGRKVVGKPIKTFVKGKIVMDEGEILAKPGSGNIICFK